MKNISKATDCVHAGKVIDPITKGMVTPVYTSTSFDYIDTDILAYPRYFNTPNQQAVSEKLRILEQGESAMVLSSGMAAISTVLFAILQKGDHVIFQNDLYGGTYHAIITEMEKYGISYSFINADSKEEMEQALQKDTKLIYVESPSNPLLKITDIRMVVDFAKNSGITSVIDNTFASPINQNPIDLGIDVVVHSGTKYLGGHSDICCGVIVTSESLMEKFWGSAIHFGGNLNAQTCSLLERSLKTLALRVERQNENAMEFAEFLKDHEMVSTVNYPGLVSFPQHSLATRQMNGFGGMLSFEIGLPVSEIDPFLKNLKIFHSAMSLGGVDSIISAPARTSHAKMTADQRAAAGIRDNLLRVSMGIEDCVDLMEDFEQALVKSRKLA
jgi:cystathionine beta-lyase